ncbi:KaiC domain-containing protein [Halorubrum sp. GN11_10-6_MGM]|uniref:KaiC domain-containing protein n=1 Tax=Halorubrum sp. GN11_10-6_MGM TaxID=2518112 RepID=UPI0010F77159|nr:KaiC domain-containing protein [Halorubrum sp. GN11_10-6_MGM]TKX75148.1 KaiC domain-containing protein [Halorubrum sp. GN11_10-6_MGM]
MSEEDDWFERALRETDEENDERPVEGAEDDAADAEANDTEADGANADSADGEADDTVTEPDSASDDGSDDPFGGVREGTNSDGDEFGGDEFSGDEFGGDEFGDDDAASGGVPADAFGDVGGDGEVGSFGEDDPFGADDPFGGSRSGGGSDARAGGRDGGETPGGGASSGGETPGGRESSGGETPGGRESNGGMSGDSSDPFGGYRGAAASDDDFGFGEFGGDGPGSGGGGKAGFDVDPDEFESEISRTDIGIEGLDDMILGGVPKRSLLSVIGGAGTGKTTFALQFLNHALESGNKGIYITLEQTRESIFDTATEKGWSFREHAAEDRLAVVAIDPIEMANSLASIRNDLVRLIAEFDADRLVLDSVSLLEMMYDHPAKRRSEVFGFTRSLKEAGVTTLLTSEASEETPYASRHGIVEYLTDAVFVLQYVRGSDFRETRLAVEIQKIRDANHSRETKPYDITDTGISVYDQANIF